MLEFFFDWEHGGFYPYASDGEQLLTKTSEGADELAALAPFTKDYPIPERGARYYLCQSGACAQPVDSIAELETLLMQNNRHEETR